jgi:hypothetical protein
MENWIHDTLSQWGSEGLEINPKSNLVDIEKAELILSFKFPEDFKQFYLVANGFSEYEWRNNLFSIWSLERIVKEYNGSFDGFIGFCDYSICVFSLGFDKKKSGIYRHYFEFQEGGIDFVSNSFEETIDLINSDSKLLY